MSSKSKIDITTAKYGAQTGAMESGSFYRHKTDGHLVFVASLSGGNKPLVTLSSGSPSKDTPVVQIGGLNNGYVLAGLFDRQDMYELVDVEIKIIPRG